MNVLKEGIKQHPLAAIFPSMSTEEFAALRESIKQQGLLQPIVTLDNTILDGRHRYLACIEVGSPANSIAYEGKDALGFVIASNLQRRHLTTSQRAMIAAEIATRKVGRFNSTNSGTIKQAATLMGVSTHSVDDAKAIRKAGLGDVVKTGKLNINEAKLIKDEPKKHRDKIVNLVNTGSSYDEAVNQTVSDGVKTLRQKKKPKGRIRELPPGPNMDEIRLFGLIHSSCEDIMKVGLTPRQWIEKIRTSEAVGSDNLANEMLPLLNPVTKWLDELRSLLMKEGKTKLRAVS